MNMQTIIGIVILLVVFAGVTIVQSEQEAMTVCQQTYSQATCFYINYR